MRTRVERAILAALFVVSLTRCGSSKGSDSPPVTTAPVAVATVTMTGAPADLIAFVDEPSQLTATTVDATGSVLTGRTVTWTSSNTAVATVSSSGFVTVAGTGAVTITAASEGKQAAVT